MLEKIKQHSEIKNLKSKNYNLYFFLLNLGFVLLWRGLWALMDKYFLPQMPLLSDLICIALGMLILYVIDFKL